MKLLGKVTKIREGEKYEAEFDKKDLAKVNKELFNKVLAYPEYSFYWYVKEGVYYAVASNEGRRY